MVQIMGLSDMNNLSGISTSQNFLARIPLVCPCSSLPKNLKPLLHRKDIQLSWILTLGHAEANDIFDQSQLVIIYPGELKEPDQKKQLGQIMQTIQQKNIPMLLLSHDKTLTNLIPPENDGSFPRVSISNPDVNTEEIWGRICAMLDFSPLFDRIHQHMSHLEDWALSLNKRFEEVHQELRLAWRVQQDFLPKKLPHKKHIRFGVLYRPASWVSGDIYDIFYLDENNIGFFVIDVVGHGVAAGLMTLFVKRALVTKEITGKEYAILDPAQAMKRLNNDLCSLSLPENQFVTACYGVMNTISNEMTLAKGGHPNPVLIKPDKSFERIQAEGPLLGIFEDSEFQSVKVSFAPGCKLVFYTDGFEQAFGNEDGEEKMVAEFVRLSHLSAKDMIDGLSASLDCQETSLHPSDDITAVIMDVHS
jgi:serine phosphatase RsbU (regulator of sigma subunit)